ncbi:MAG: hypothetical protein AAF919_07665 [Pseudomonadota bacterium]
MKDEQMPLDDQARAILTGNDRGGYTVPTDGLYPYQWNWDSAFAAWGFSHFDIDRAWTELETLISGQWSDGMIPHILFHRPDPGYFPGPDVWQGRGPIPSSGITQPPVAASFARRIHQADPGQSRLKALWPALRRWHDWFMAWRLDDGNAVCVTHPWEAGRDNAPDWDAALKHVDPTGVGPYQRRDTGHVDPAMRPTAFDYDRYIKLVQVGVQHGWDHAALKRHTPFRVADPTMTFILLRAQRDLLETGTELGLDTSGLPDAIARLEDGARSLFNPTIQSYDSRDVRTGRWAGGISNAAFLCWYGGLTDDRMRDVLERVGLTSRYALPSYDPASSLHEPLRYWRGPVWPIMNYLVGIGLEEQGLTDQAARLRADTRALIEAGGFAEYYHPQTGQPAGGGTFTWTAAVWLGWAGRG